MTAGFTVGGPVGAVAAGVGAPVMTALRQYGINKEDDLVRDAMLDPGLAKLLLQQPTTEKQTGAIMKLIADRYRSAALAGEASTEDESPPELVSVKIDGRR